MPNASPSLAAPLPLEQARPVHARWSEVNGEFLDHVARHPEYLERGSFASLGGEPSLKRFSIQPWPLFLGPEQRREVERTTLGMDRLVKDTLERFLRHDTARVLDFYRVGEGIDGRRGLLAHPRSELVLAMVLEEPNGLRSAPSRADYLEDAQGLRCLEFNAGGFLGGIPAGAIAERYLSCPPVVRFLEDRGRRARAPGTVAALLAHLVDDTVRSGAWSGGELNVALVVWPNDPGQGAVFVEADYDRELRRVLEERGIPGGRVIVCGAEELREEGRSLYVGGHRVHVVSEHHDGTADMRMPYRLYKAGRVNFIGGSIGSILCDKRNLALISENAGSAEYTAEERALIERHVPWTRRVHPARTTFRGRGLRLPDGLADRRAEFVLKKATSLGGRHVRVGRFRTEREWRQDLAQAFHEGDWIVQEYLETLPYLFQSGESGAARHDMVWGLFAFGGRFGGAFLRMQPHDGGSGVVNTEQGAWVGACLELEDDAPRGDAPAPPPPAAVRVHSLAPAAPGPMAEARPFHARWSELNARFLDFAAQNPEYLERATFASRSGETEAPPLRDFPIQPWPFFMGPERRREVERLALGMDRLVRGALERFLAGDPARVLEFYRVGAGLDGTRGPVTLPTSELMLAMILEEPDGIRGAPSRGDYLEDRDGLKLLEYNAGGFLGGYYSTLVGERYLASPPVARFLEETGSRARAPGTVEALVRHHVEETLRMGAWRGGELNVALVVRPNTAQDEVKFPAGEFARALRRVLEERGIPGGRALPCGPEDFCEEGRTLFVGEHPVHLVVEHHDGSADLRLAFRLFKAGRVNFVSGPIGPILSDKRNLALLSENARSDELSAEERGLIERHLPWTRMVRPALTTFRGRGLRIPDDLPDRRAELVLKKATSLGGLHVRVGRFRSEAEWRQDLAQAVHEADWIVQEYLETVPYCFQHGASGAARHDAVWGLFAFGDRFGGATLRMQLHGGSGVVNAAQGAELGACLELEEAAVRPAAPAPLPARVQTSDAAPGIPRPLLELTRPVHARWSKLNGEFLDHAAEHPEYLEAGSFASLKQPWMRSFQFQPWPLFLGGEQRRELERLALGMDGLIKGAVERFLAGDPARILDFYRSEGRMDGRRGPLAFRPSEALLAMLLEEPVGIRSIPTRTDFLESPEGLKCLEYNATGLGAMQLDGVGEAYLACPPIAGFLEAKRRRARAPDTLTAAFRHLVEQTVRMGVWDGGEFNASVLLWPNGEDQAAMFVEEMYTGALRRALAERGMPAGRVFMCAMEDFRHERNSLFVGEHRVHLVMEHHDGSADQRLLFRLFKSGGLNLVCGPIGYVLGDKRNLALLSENARSDEFTAGERGLIERHLPWTRTVRPALTTFRGRGFRIPDDLVGRRAELVLKKGGSLSGREVHVGRFRSESEWREDVARAVAEADWIVQEYMETVPYCFQVGERGAMRHDMVWGLLAFGEHYGGTLLRTQPHGRGSGVVNSEQGAKLTLFLELEDDAPRGGAQAPAAPAAARGHAPAPAAPDPMAEARPFHARWSELNAEFLDHAAAHPEYLDRAGFASLAAAEWMRIFPMQSWPLFLGARQRDELARMTLGMDRLIKGSLERFLGSDPARIMDFYRAGADEQGRRGPLALQMSEFMLALLLEDPNGLRSAPSRTDYLEDPDGLKCLEYNAGGCLGGMQLDGMGELYLSCSPVARFLEARRRRARAPDTLHAQFRHLVAETERMGAWSGGEFNVGLVAHPNEPVQAGVFVDAMYNRALREVLAERGIPGGRVFICAPEDLREERRSLYIGEHPVHLVLEHHDGSADLRAVFRVFKTGRVNFVSGPIANLLCDKRNLALISENAASAEFTAGERGLIERHVPWTRRVLPVSTTFRGRGLRLPDGLVDRRGDFVLKKATSLAGYHVHVGRFRTESQWREDVARALREEDWIVQEYLETVPYCFQAGERGAVRHDMVWGLFAFGDHFGGAFLRVMARGGGSGVVNAAQGAQVGVALELED